MRKICFFLLIFLFINLGSLYSQEFGKNKVVILTPHWRIAETPHFYFYYYSKTATLVPKVAQILEKSYEKITKDLNIETEEKLPFFLYGTHNDFEQTNIADVDEGVGGFTELFKNRFVIPLDGSEKWMETVILHEMAHALTFTVFYGGRFWRSVYLAKSLFYPLWFIEGIAEYETGLWDTQADMILRDATINDLLIPLNKLSSFEHLQSNQIELAYKQGQSVVQYIGEKYGSQKVADLLYLLKDSIDVSGALQTAIRKDLFKFNKEWQKYLKEKYAKIIENKKEASDYGTKITAKGYYNRFASFSPNGGKIVFLTDADKYFDLWIMEDEGSKKHSLLGRRNRRAFDYLKLRGNIFSWSSDSQKIVFAAEKLQREYLFIYDLKRKKLRRIKVNLDEVSSPSFSPEGDKIIFAGLENGVNDLYLIDIDGKNLQRITNDEYDDNFPVFSPDGKSILYTSERDKKRHLFLLDLNSTDIKQLTYSEQEEFAPSWIGNGEILYISDLTGIYNVYILNLVTQEKQQLTDIKGGILYAQFSPPQDKFLFSAYEKGMANIYIGEKNRLERHFLTKSPEIPTLTVAVVNHSETTPSKDLILADYPYRFKASTDLIFPFLLYSTSGGLYTIGYWQISEMLGNHTLTTMVEYYSEDGWLNSEISYKYKKYRPQFSVGILGRTDYYYNSNSDLVRRKKIGEQFVVSYPLNRFNRLETGFTNLEERRRNRSQNDFVDKERENIVSFSLIRDLTSGEGFDLMYGYRFNLTTQFARNFIDADYDYNIYNLIYENYKTIFNNKILAFRFLGADSRGPDAKVFSVGNRNDLRGYDEINGTKILVLNSEFRFYIFSRINYHMWYLIPDLYFKSLQAVFFTDNGVVGNKWPVIKSRGSEDLKNSVGIGLRLNTFILQRIPLILRLDYARRTDIDHKGIFYFTVGSIF